MNAASVQADRPGRRWAVVVVACVVFYAIVGSLILLHSNSGPQAHDQNTYHIPVIRSFSEQLPAPDISDYNLAMTPGYHLALAVVDRVVSSDLRVLQLINSCFGMLLVLFVLWQAWRFIGAWQGFALLTPLLFSGYLLRGSAYVNTDNVALLLVSIVVAGVAFKPSTPARSLGFGVVAMIGVSIRQIQVWPAGLILFAGLLVSPLAKFVPWLPGAAPRDGRWTNLVAAAVGFLLPWLVIASFFWLWGGMTPPMMTLKHASGLALVTPAYSLALFACFGLFYLPVAVGSRIMNRRILGWILPGILVGVVAAVAVPTSFEAAAGINGGGTLWISAQKFPSFGDRSSLILVLAPIGGAMVGLFVRQMMAVGNGRTGIILLVALIGFICAQTMNPQVSQRYFEPILLILLTWMAAAGVSDSSGRGWIVGPAILGLAQLLMLLPRLGIIPGWI